MGWFTDRRARAVLGVLCWKLVLLLLCWLPVPANDSFFYDGGVVNLLLHGGYFNPSVALNYPISGREFFSAYPPVSQGLLLVWMAVFGPSEFSAMTLHFVMFAAYALLLLGTLVRLGLPAWSTNLAGLFLLGITFHDRPDSAAHLFGMLAVYAWVRTAFVQDSPRGPVLATRWSWVMTGGVVLSLAASLQIGAAYGLLVWICILLARQAQGTPAPVSQMIMMVAVPLILIGGVASFLPLFCRGFLESAYLTSFLQGFHTLRVSDALKVLRSVPGVFVCTALTLLAAGQWRRGGARRLDPAGILGLAALLTALPIIAISLGLVAANTVAIAAYLQPLVVGGIAASGTFGLPKRAPRPAVFAALLAAAVLCSVRAVGMSTWGVMCARDVSARQALRMADNQLNKARPGQTVVLSAAYLYRAARHTDVRWIHADHPGPFNTGRRLPELASLKTLRPASLVLTQFDYYRRYEPVVRDLQQHPEQVVVRVTQTATVPAPDSIPLLRRVLQHVSWAPVIVEFEWQGES